MCICRKLCRKLSQTVALQHAATHCNILQHTATHCNTLQHTATHQLTVESSPRLLHCNTLQHTATHCNTLQHTATHQLTVESSSRQFDLHPAAPPWWVMPHIWVSHVPHMYDPCPTYEKVMSHTQFGLHPAAPACWVMSLIWVSHVTGENSSCPTYEGAIWSINTIITCIYTVRLHLYTHSSVYLLLLPPHESCHTYGWAMSSIRMRHVTYESSHVLQLRGYDLYAAISSPNESAVFFLQRKAIRVDLYFNCPRMWWSHFFRLKSAHWAMCSKIPRTCRPVQSIMYSQFYLGWHIRQLFQSSKLKARKSLFTKT